MVSDSQYNELREKVVSLEKKVDYLSRELSRLVFKGEAKANVMSITEDKTKKDKTKYRFENKVYCKRRIVYVCVRKYISDNNIESFIDLQAAFPDYLQGSLGVIKPIEEANMYSNAHRRFYFADEDILHLNGKLYVICSQWEKKNINRFLSVAKDLGYSIQPITIE